MGEKRSVNIDVLYLEIVWHPSPVRQPQAVLQTTASELAVSKPEGA
jgi:hypothetical protein